MGTRNTAGLWKNPQEWDMKNRVWNVILDVIPTFKIRGQMTPKTGGNKIAFTALEHKQEKACENWNLYHGVKTMNRKRYYARQASL